MIRPSKRSPQLAGDLWAIVSALTTAIGLALAKTVLDEIPPLTFNTYVFFFGTPIIFIDAAINRKIKETVVVPARHLGFFAILGVLFSASTLCLFTAISYTEPATVSFLSRLELFMTILMAMIFLKEHISKAEVIGLAFVVIGILVMRYGASIQLSNAIILVSIEAVFTGAAEVAIKARINRIRPRSLIFYRGIVMVSIFLIVGYFTGQFVWVTDLRILLTMAVAGFCLPYAGRMGYLKAMERINISRASIIVQSQPFFTALITLAILGTHPSLRVLIGGLLIVAGVIFIRIIEWRLRRKTAVM